MVSEKGGHDTCQRRAFPGHHEGTLKLKVHHLTNVEWLLKYKEVKLQLLEQH
ncbi:hypothetical protein DPMN_182916 [Dreissena polymorpha]|uniref:Uncharacterized protein n=1 Tax=Dreissena polymorpha TaxID=45954 RepID=A0A9D4DH86_DREPO|nr:hypothetical protein DPMN_072271 [Dreissena polymorpha]KAH3748470.1 hypothetical protein DPMN_182916 [Dreissena polymorpha]